MYGRYLDIPDQLRSHPNIGYRALGALTPWVFPLTGDLGLTWKMRDTGTPLNRIWNRHWNTPPEYHFWLYNELARGNLDALYQLGPGTGVNLGELYVALYAAHPDGVAFFVMSTRTGRRIGVDTGWRPIELRGERYQYAVSRFTFF